MKNVPHSLPSSPATGSARCAAQRQAPAGDPIRRDIRARSETARRTGYPACAHRR